MLKYKLKVKNEDFNVTEIFPLVFSEGKYSYYILQKSGFRTMEAIEIISEKLKIQSEQIAYSGLKDEDAVTTQFISIENIKIDELSVNDGERWMNLRYLGNSSTQMKIGQLLGNAFVVKIRNLDYSTAENIKWYSGRNVTMINYYDIQRFGKPNFPKISFNIGHSILRSDYDKMLDLLLITDNISNIEYQKYIKKGELYIYDTDKRKLNFFLSSYDSYIWNKKIHEFLIQNTLDYDIIKREEIDFIYSNINDSLRDELNRLHISRHVFDDNMIITEKESYRQPYIDVIPNISEIKNDDKFIGRYMLDAKFMLPSGSYATAFIDQLIWKINKK